MEKIKMKFAVREMGDGFFEFKNLETGCKAIVHHLATEASVNLFNSSGDLVETKHVKFEEVGATVFSFLEAPAAPVKIKAVKPMMVRIDTRYYELAHSRKPRGRGLWIFYIGNPENKQHFVTRSNTLYAEAVKQVKDYCRKNGISEARLAS